MRTIHPLIDGDGSCSLIYDLERASILDVPEDLQFHIAPALETGDPDEDLLSWLVSEDLVTSERCTFGEMGETTASREAGWWTLGAVYRGDGEIRARIDGATEEMLHESLELIFKQSFGAAKVCLHFGWGGAFPGLPLLTTAVVIARRWAAAAGQEVAFELTLDATAATPAVLSLLADYPYHVRLRCGAFPARDGGERTSSWSAVERGVRLLIGIFPERVTVECQLAERARLLDLWTWAKELGIRHLDSARQEGSGAWNQTPPAELRAYRGDLLAVQEEMGDTLEMGRPDRLPVDYQPLTRVVRSLMRSEPLARLAPAFRHDRSEQTVAAFAADPLFAGLPRLGSEVHGDGEEAEGFACRECWARYVCSHSVVAAPPLESDHRTPTRDRCALWRTEVEVALRFHHRLAHADPVQALRLFADARQPVERFDSRGLGEQSRVF